MPSNASKPRKAVTIKDVAARAETSIATVSYVFSNAERYLRPELRERVLKAAAEIGYVKNAAASAIKGKHRGILAVVVGQFGKGFFARMCVEIVSLARQAGYVVTLCNSDEDLQQERLILERLVSHRIDGCILSPALSSAENVALLERHRIPFVIFERELPGQRAPYDFVGHDNFQSGFLATRQLLAAGHRRIAFAGWDSPIPNVRARVDGYRAALREAGVAPTEELVLTDELSAAGGRRMAARLLEAGCRAAVLGHHDTARGTLEHFQDIGVQWPGDVSLVVIGTPEWADILRPRVTCIQRPEHEMAAAAAGTLLDSIRNPDHVPVRQLFSCTVVAGESVQERIEVPLHSLA